jgi:retron-type reverse transcriptase
MTRYEFRELLTSDEQAALVMKAVRAHQDLSPLLRVNIQKGGGKEGTRPLSYPTTIDAVRLMILADWLGAYAETVLSPVAVAYRPNKAVDATIRGGVTTIRAGKLPMVAATDIKGFFDNIQWKHLERVIERLPADQNIKALLRAAIRAEVRDRETGDRITRTAGTPQGLAVSPVLANLVLHESDVRLQRIVNPRGGLILRYADDYNSANTTETAANTSAEALRHHLGELGLQVKAGTGDVIDLREPGASVVWLGVELRMGRDGLVINVPEKSVIGKAADLQGEFQAGLLSREGVLDRINDLHWHYAQLVTEAEAARAIRSLWALVQNNETRKEVA